MCGRIANGAKPGYLREQFDEAAASDILEEPGLLPRYNLAPSQYLPGIRNAETRGTEWAVFRWGLIPAWAKPDKIPDRTFNARSETVAQKPTFREAYKKRRCIIPISGYYEWTGAKGHKQPFYFHHKENKPVILAGLWETWKQEDTVVESCTVLTTDADKKMSDYHHRMPVILEKSLIPEWLNHEKDSLHTILDHMDTGPVDIYPVSKEVNNSRTDHPGLIQEIPRLL